MNTSERDFLMPAIVLRMSFKGILGKKWGAEELIDFLSKSFGVLEEEVFLEDFLTLQSWGTPKRTGEQELETWRDRLLASFTFGMSGEIKIGLVNSLYPNCYEFWICSSKAADCVEGRRWVVKKVPGIRNRTLRKIENDFLFLEGGTEINREKMFWSYIIKSGLNVGLLVNFIVLLSSSLYSYINTGNLDYGLPSLIFAIWFIALISTIVYYRRRVMYIVK